MKQTHTVPTINIPLVAKTMTRGITRVYNTGFNNGVYKIESDNGRLIHTTNSYEAANDYVREFNQEIYNLGG